MLLKAIDVKRRYVAQQEGDHFKYDGTRFAVQCCWACNTWAVTTELGISDQSGVVQGGQCVQRGGRKGNDERGHERLEGPSLFIRLGVVAGWLCG